MKKGSLRDQIILRLPFIVLKLDVQQVKPYNEWENMYMKYLW